MPLRTVVLLLLLTAAAAALFFFFEEETPLGDAFNKPPFESICYPHHRKYHAALCGDIGKHAFPIEAVRSVTSVDYGSITGVAWRNKGNIISRPGDVKRFSENNDYYYIVCPSSAPESCQLRLRTEVEARLP